jgi:hypothetical protein
MAAALLLEAPGLCTCVLSSQQRNAESLRAPELHGVALLQRQVMTRVVSGVPLMALTR